MADVFENFSLGFSYLEDQVAGASNHVFGSEFSTTHAAEKYAAQLASDSDAKPGDQYKLYQIAAAAETKGSPLTPEEAAQASGVEVGSDDAKRLGIENIANAQESIGVPWKLLGALGLIAAVLVMVKR